MLGILYLLNCILVGAVFCDFFLPKLSERCIYSKDGKTVRIPGFFVLFPAWYITGTVFQSWIVYFVAYGFRSLRHPLTPANAIVLPTLFVFAIIYFTVKLIRKRQEPFSDKIDSFFFGDMFGYLIFVVAIFIFAYQVMYRTLYVKDGELNIGYSVWADFGAHLGMIRSFSYGNNFPTQYTYFGGEDIRYHFMFQFLVGNLEYLGLRIDHAFNIPSILNFISMYLLLFTLTVRLLGSRLTAWLGALFFTFRSSPSFFIYLGENTRAKTAGVEGSGVSAWTLYKELSRYFSYSEYHEGWGFWCTRAFANQRHFALGISGLLLALVVFLPYIQAMGTKLISVKLSLKNRKADNADERIEIIEEENSDKEEEKESAYDLFPYIEAALTYIKEIFFTADGWKFIDVKMAIGTGLFLGALGFWHGSALIATLSMLFFMAAFSLGRLDYLVTAGITVVLAFIQTKIFIRGTAVAPEYFFGFIADNRTFWGVMLYIGMLTGITLLIAIFGALKYRGVKRYMLFVFFVPFVLSFFLKLTPDIGVNQKWVIIALMLISMFTADFVAGFIKHRDISKLIVALIMVFCLTATGVAELKIQKNEDKNHMVFEENHPVTMWIKENISSQDLVLTDTYPISPMVLCGISSYYSYPYCVWSAGYNTDYRFALVCEIFSAESSKELDYYINISGIDYIILDITIRECEDYELNEATIENTYEEVFTYGEGAWAIRIFDTHKPIYK